MLGIPLFFFLIKKFKSCITVTTWPTHAHRIPLFLLAYEIAIWKVLFSHFPTQRPHLLGWIRIDSYKMVMLSNVYFSFILNGWISQGTWLFRILVINWMIGILRKEVGYHLSISFLLLHQSIQSNHEIIKLSNYKSSKLTSPTSKTCLRSRWSISYNSTRKYVPKTKYTEGGQMLEMM